MGDGAVGLAVAHRRAVRPARRVHQDRGLAVERQPLVEAGRGVALHALAFGRREAGLVRESRARRRSAATRCASAPWPVTHDIAPFERMLRRQREGDVDAVGRQPVAGAVRPFHQHDALLGRSSKPEFGEFVRTGEPVEIGMHQREARQVVGLHQRESRARHRDRRIASRDARISARANVVLPAPRSPDSVTKSPGSSALRDVGREAAASPPHPRARVRNGKRRDEDGMSGQAAATFSAGRLERERCR